MVVREGYGRHRRAQHDINVLEQRHPARPQPAPDAAFTDPICMADCQATQLGRSEALIVGRQILDRRRGPLERFRR